MSRRSNYHDNAVAERFFATIKKRIVKKQIYSARNDAKAEIFNVIEMLYNPIKRHLLIQVVFRLPNLRMRTFRNYRLSSEGWEVQSAGLIVHTDRGCQYANKVYRTLLLANGIEAR